MTKKEEYYIHSKQLESAFDKLSFAINNDEHDDIRRDAIVQRFEFTIELVRKNIKKLLD
jgi:hypothetical protein